MGGFGSPRSAIQVSGIRKSYGSTVAVADVSIEVNEGEIFGLIGPNGAGKTTTMECVEGVRRPDRGTISILGLDPIPRRVRASEPDRRTCSILSMGFLIASLVPTARFAQPIGAAMLYPMLGLCGLCGLFVPLRSLPPPLHAVARAIPLTYAVSLLEGT